MIYRADDVKEYIKNPNAFLTIEMRSTILEEFINQALDNHWKEGDEHSCGGHFVRTPITIRVDNFKRPVLLDAAICDECGEIGMFCRGDDKCRHCNGEETFVGL